MKLPFDSNRRTLIQGAGALATAAALPVLAASDSATQTEPEPDKYGIRTYYAPEIELDYWIDANGKSTSFSVLEQKGKWVFLKFFQNWCPGCHSSGFPTLQKFAAKFSEHPDVAIAAVQTVFEGFGTNTQDAVRELQLRYDLPITMGHDVGTEETRNHPLTMINYRTGGTPWLVLIAPDGSVVFNDFHVNPDGLIQYVSEQVS